MSIVDSRRLYNIDCSVFIIISCETLRLYYACALIASFKCSSTIYIRLSFFLLKKMKVYFWCRF